VGPLRDVFGLSDTEARDVLNALQMSGVLEGGDSPMLRFVRLSENPLGKGEEGA
jgi:hypothetical protein